MKRLILPLATVFALGLSGAAMAENAGSDHGKVASQDHSIVATVSGPQLLTDSQMDEVVAGNALLGTAATLGDYIEIQSTPHWGNLFVCNVPSSTALTGFGGGGASAHSGTGVCPLSGPPAGAPVYY